MALHSFSRRSFLSVGALTLFGRFRLGEALALRAAAPGSSPKPEDLSIILLWLAGGLSQFESWDPKPAAKEGYRSKFGSIPTNVPGIQVGELLPLSARHADKYTIIRSMTSQDAVHESAQAFMLSGHAPRSTLQFPSYGSVIAKELSPRNELPPYILTGGPVRKWEQAAFLGPKYNPFLADDPNKENYKVRDLDLPLGVDWARVDRRNSLLRLADRQFRRMDTLGIVDAMDTHHQTALTLIRSERAKRAFKIESEPEKLREKYGRTSLGQGCLLARRLVEEGVRFVSVRSGGWDHHFNLFNDISTKKLPELDRAFAALLEDLNDRGMLGTTMVIVGTEFGRTPEINVNDGRDHWPAAFSLVTAGGGVEGGRTLGATDQNCWEVVERPVHVPDFIATIYAKLGIDYHQMYQSNVGRPVRVIDEPFEAVQELLT